jgi:hypothetical protein
VQTSCRQPSLNSETDKKKKKKKSRITSQDDTSVGKPPRNNRSGVVDQEYNECPPNR